MTLDEFINEQKSLVQSFKDDWISDNKRTPDDFPMSMDEGEWDEQFSAYSN